MILAVSRLRPRDGPLLWPAADTGRFKASDAVIGN
jgi:hypothetical protein